MTARDPHVIKPPTNASRHRRWRVWYDFGEMASGQCVRETGWRAKCPDGRLLEATGWDALLTAVDQLEDAAAETRGDRLPLIHVQPPAVALAYSGENE